jgi:mannose-6-phosphate isomerase
VLAAEQPLSIQVHPDRSQARSAFAAQHAGYGQGPYTDDWPKPELLYALSPFEVLAGSRPPGYAAAVLDGLGLTALRPVTALLRSGDGEAGLIAALRTVLTWPEPDRRTLVSDVVRSSLRRAEEAGPYAAAYAAVERMSAHHPGDLGLVASLLLRHRILDAGSAMFMPAGGLHAYIRGVGVELMAASDNVLRAGLTSKEVNVEELLRIADPAVRVPLIQPAEVSGASRTQVFDCPAEEFALYRTQLRTESAPLVPSSGPRIVLCTDGIAVLRAPDGTSLSLRPGASCFVPDSDRGITLEGSGTVFTATTGLGLRSPLTSKE